jgi:LL-diaminopimelate aminotransferase
MAALESIGLSARVSQGTIYVWAKIPAGYTSAEFSNHVLDAAGVIVPAGSAYGPDGEGYIRISLATPDDRLAEALERMRTQL